LSLEGQGQEGSHLKFDPSWSPRMGCSYSGFVESTVCPGSKGFFAMARIPYADVSRLDTKRLVDRIVLGRGSILHLYRMLLHSPPVAEGWLEFLTAIRQKSTLPGALRELVIMRIASLNGASYEAAQHAPRAQPATTGRCPCLGQIPAFQRVACRRKRDVDLAHLEAGYA
jgi:hypothetical protein